MTSFVAEPAHHLCSLSDIATLVLYVYAVRSTPLSRVQHSANFSQRDQYCQSCVVILHSGQSTLCATPLLAVSWLARMVLIAHIYTVLLSALLRLPHRLCREQSIKRPRNPRQRHPARGTTHVPVLAWKC